MQNEPSTGSRYRRYQYSTSTKPEGELREGQALGNRSSCVGTPPRHRDVGSCRLHSPPSRGRPVVSEPVERSARPFCPCHHEPMTPVNNRPCGWRCSVKHRTAQAKYRNRRMSDPIFRITESLRVDAYQRRRVTERLEAMVA